MKSIDIHSDRQTDRQTDRMKGTSALNYPQSPPQSFLEEEGDVEEGEGRTPSRSQPSNKYYISETSISGEDSSYKSPNQSPHYIPQYQKNFLNQFQSNNLPNSLAQAPLQHLQHLPQQQLTNRNNSNNNNNNNHYPKQIFYSPENNDGNPNMNSPTEYFMTPPESDERAQHISQPMDGRPFPLPNSVLSSEFSSDVIQQDSDQYWDSEDGDSSSDIIQKLQQAQPQSQIQSSEPTSTSTAQQTQTQTQTQLQRSTSSKTHARRKSTDSMTGGGDTSGSKTHTRRRSADSATNGYGNGGNGDNKKTHIRKRSGDAAAANLMTGGINWIGMTKDGLPIPAPPQNGIGIGMLSRMQEVTPIKEEYTEEDSTDGIMGHMNFLMRKRSSSGGSGGGGGGGKSRGHKNKSSKAKERISNMGVLGIRENYQNQEPNNYDYQRKYSDGSSRSHPKKIVGKYQYSDEGNIADEDDENERDCPPGRHTSGKLKRRVSASAESMDESSAGESLATLSSVFSWISGRLSVFSSQQQPNLPDAGTAIAPSETRRTDQSQLVQSDLDDMEDDCVPKVFSCTLNEHVQSGSDLDEMSQEYYNYNANMRPPSRNNSMGSSGPYLPHHPSSSSSTRFSIPPRHSAPLPVRITKPSHASFEKPFYRPAYVSMGDPHDQDLKNVPTFVCPNCHTKQRKFFSMDTAPSRFESPSAYFILFLIIYFVAALTLFRFEEKWKPLDCIYFSVITLTTTGLGDLVPTTQKAKIFCVLFIYLGVACIGLLMGSLVANVMDDRSKQKSNQFLMEHCSYCNFQQDLTNPHSNTKSGGIWKHKQKPQHDYLSKEQLAPMGAYSESTVSNHSIATSLQNRSDYGSLNVNPVRVDSNQSIKSSDYQSASSLEEVDEERPMVSTDHHIHHHHHSLSSSKNHGVGNKSQWSNPKRIRSKHISMDHQSMEKLLNQTQSSSFHDNDHMGHDKMNEKQQNIPHHVDIFNSPTSIASGFNHHHGSGVRGRKNLSMSFVLSTLRKALINSILIIAIGAIGVHFLEELDTVNSVYFATVLLTTVGYGDIAPNTDAGKCFATLYVLVAGTILLNNMSLISMIPIELRRMRLENAILRQVRIWFIFVY